MKNQKKSQKAIELFEREIDALVNLRTRLISDVVTGQVDVRGVKVPEYESVEDVDVEQIEEQEEEMEVE